MKDCPFCCSDQVRMVELPVHEFEVVKVGERWVAEKVWNFEYYVMCMECKAKGPTTGDKEEAEKKWDVPGKRLYDALYYIR